LVEDLEDSPMPQAFFGILREMEQGIENKFRVLVEETRAEMDLV